MNLKDKVVLITGASAGIGATTAIFFAREGANVAIVGRNQQRLKEVAEQCEKAGKKALIIQADVSKEAEANATVKKTIDSYGKIDVLVNNAGIIAQAGILDSNVMETYDKLMNTNMRAVMLLTSLVAPYLVKTKGNIVNVSSMSGFQIKWPTYLSYKISKAALNHFNSIVAVDLATYGVRVNAVSPGPVSTDIFNNSGVPEEMENLASETALNRISTTDEVADLIVYLASDKARGITGSNYVIDNGTLLK